MPFSFDFEKFQGCGNDFIFVDKDVLSSFSSPTELQKFAIQVCHRNFGIGADGVVFYDAKAHKLFILNSDGSFATTCGNALRCYGLKLLMQGLWEGKSVLDIKPLSFRDTTLDPPVKPGDDAAGSIPFATLIEGNLKSRQIRVAMGWESQVKIVKISDNKFNLSPLSCVYVQLANPHLVYVSSDFSQFSLDQLKSFGQWAQGEFLDQFAGEIPVCNISMLSLSSRGEPTGDAAGSIPKLTVYERGAGLTLCCGSGAVASRVAMEALSLLNTEQDKVTFHLPGGSVDISCIDVNGHKQRTLTGEAQFVYKGKMQWI
jgi:diaminopimelate epimerase